MDISNGSRTTVDNLGCRHRHVDRLRRSARAVRAPLKPSKPDALWPNGHWAQPSEAKVSCAARPRSVLTGRREATKPCELASVSSFRLVAWEYLNWMFWIKSCSKSFIKLSLHVGTVIIWGFLPKKEAAITEELGGQHSSSVADPNFPF
jgi:hypothetical protein